MSLKLRKNSFLQSLIVGLCDTQIGGFSPILTKKTHQKIVLKIGEKIGRFFLSEKVGRIFCLCGNRLVGHKL